MLILSRRVGETIVIGSGADAIRVTVVGIDRGQAKIGIDAPRDVEVHRDEVRARIDQERASGVSVSRRGNW